MCVKEWQLMNGHGFRYRGFLINDSCVGMRYRRMVLGVRCITGCRLVSFEIVDTIVALIGVIVVATVVIVNVTVVAGSTVNARIPPNRRRLLSAWFECCERNNTLHLTFTFQFSVKVFWVGRSSTSGQSC
jgi:hypothetical protein